MLYNRLLFALLFLVFGLSVSIDGGEKDILLHDLRLCREFLDNNAKYAFDVGISYHNSDGSVLKANGEYVKYNQFHFTEMDSMRSLRTETRELTISERDKRIYYKTGSLGEWSGRHPIDSIYRILDNVATLHYSQTRVGISVYTFTFIDQAYKQVEVTLNTTEKYLERIKMLPSNPAALQGIELVDIRYKLQKGRVRLKEDKYKFEHYLIQEKEGLHLTSQYQDYFLHRLN